MKRILLVLLLLTASLAGCKQGDKESDEQSDKQSNVTEFWGIPVEGSKSTMIEKLRRKNFVYDPFEDCLEGEFNGAEVRILIQTQNGRVWRLVVIDKAFYNEDEIKTRYDNLCKQFASSSKYSPISITPFLESEERKSEYNACKECQAIYTQFPEKEDSFNRTVWFTISRQDLSPRCSLVPHYSIVMYYENGFNEANGEDL